MTGNDVTNLSRPWDHVLQLIPPVPCCISLQSPLPLLWRLQLPLTFFMLTLALPSSVRLCFFLFFLILHSLLPSANALYLLYLLTLSFFFELRAHAVAQYIY